MLFFIADVKNPCRRRPRHPRGVCTSNFPLGCEIFCGLRAGFSRPSLPGRSVARLPSCFTTFTEGIRAHGLSTEPSSSETRAPAVGLGVPAHPASRPEFFALAFMDFAPRTRADRRYDAGNFPSALARWHRGSARAIKRNRQRAREQTNQCHWIRGFSSHRGLLNTNRTVTTLVTGEVSGGPNEKRQSFAQLTTVEKCSPRLSREVEVSCGSCRPTCLQLAVNS